MPQEKIKPTPWNGLDPSKEHYRYIRPTYWNGLRDKDGEKRKPRCQEKKIKKSEPPEEQGGVE